jgi:hypothetical protein
MSRKQKSSKIEPVVRDLNTDLNEQTQYSVSIWEIMLITLGAIALLGAGLSGLGAKLLINMFEPSRAETIAKSLISYHIPGGSQGVAGINIGAEKFAIVKSNSDPPDIVLSISKAPIGQAKDGLDVSLESEMSLQENINGKFAADASYQENKIFCDRNLSVNIQQGQQILANSPTPVPAMQYSVKTTKDNIEYAVNLLTLGKDAKQKAEQVFSSFKCRF